MYRGRANVDLALELEIRRRLTDEAAAMLEDIKSAARKAWETKTANDADFSTWAFVQIMKAIRQKWYRRFDELARELAPLMKSKTDKRTQRQIVGRLKEIGFAISYNPSAREMKWLVEFSRQNVQAIKKIPQFLASHAQAAIVASYKNGRDFAYLSDRLEKMGDLTEDMARLTARDQLNRLTQQMAIQNAKAYGVTKARWIHVPGFYSSRRTHIKFNGKVFNLDEGLYDSDAKMTVKPGQLKYCNCTLQIVAPGFEE